MLGDVIVSPGRNLIESGADEIRLPEKVMQVLLVLREHAGESVRREYLLDRVWGEGRGSDELLNNAISRLRHALGSKGKTFDPIETVPKFGYRLAITPQALPSRRRLSWIVLASVVLVMVVMVYLFTDTRSNAPTAVQTPHRVNLTQLVGLETSPAFSPDGRQLMFLQIKHGTTHNNLHIQNLDTGHVVQLTHDQSHKWFPIWSPDGSTIAYISRGREGCEIILINASESSAPRSRSCRADGVGALAWHPEGERIILTAYERGQPSPRLLSLEVSSGDVVAYAEDEPAGFIAFSAKGNQAVWLKGTEHADVLVHQYLSNGRRSEIKLPFDDSALVEWSFDQEAVIVLRSVKSTSHEIWQFELESDKPPTLLASLDANVDRFTVNRKTQLLAYDHYTARQQIMLLDLSNGAIDRSLESSSRDMHPVARPNGELMSFRSNRTGNEGIWQIAYAADRAPQKLFESEGIIAGHDWSPEGHEIVYSTQEPGGNFVIVLREQDDLGRETVLTSAPDSDALFPSFAGSSRYVLYTEQRSDGSRRVIHLDRVTGERLEYAHDYDVMLARSGPLGGIYFTRADADGIWLIQPENSKPVLLTDSLAIRDWGKWGVSPDGTTLAYFVRDNDRLFVETFKISTKSRQRFEIHNYLMGRGPNLAFLNFELIAMVTDDNYSGDIEALHLSH